MIDRVSMPKIDVNPNDWEEINHILKTYLPTNEVWVFGSRVKGTAKPYSDLDLAVIANKPLSIHDYAELKEAFDESDLPYRVDIVDWAATSESFKNIIRLDKIVVQLPEEGQADWPIVTLKDAGVTLIDCDHKIPKAQEEGLPYVGIPQLKEGRILLEGARLISE